MENLPVYIPAVFVLTTAFATWLLYKATRDSKLVVLLILFWLGTQSLLTSTGFYTVYDTLPPRMALLVLPPLFVVAALSFTYRGKLFMDSLNPALLTLLHLVRVPVEVVLFWLFIQGGLPELMTFEGRSFDILAGLSAPVIYYFGFVKNRLPKSVLIGWNLLSLGLLLNIVIHGILSVPTPFQQFGFEQPNIAMAYFPFIWLPGYLVPLVLFSHIATLRALLNHSPKMSSRRKPETVKSIFS